MSDETLDIVETPAAAAPVAPVPTATTAPAAPEPAKADWRREHVTNLKTLAKDPAAIDEAKILRRLERYQSPYAVTDALLQVQERFGRGELRSVLPKDAKPEDVAKWRAENGIPEKPEAYEVKLRPGVQLDEADQSIVDGLRQVAHGAHMQPGQLQATIDYIHGAAEAKAAARAEADTQALRATEDHFRQLWGPDYRRNRAVVDAYLESGPEGLRDFLFQARGPDGKPLGSSVALLSFLTDRAREVIDANTVMPGDAASMSKANADEMNQFRALMANMSSEYYKGPKANQLQERYRELIVAERRMKERPQH